MREPGRLTPRRRPLLTALATAAVGLTLVATANPTSPAAANGVVETPVAGESSTLTLPASKFVPITPTRVLDTRPEFPPNRGFARLADNTALSVDPIGGTSVATQLSNLGIAPSAVTAVVVNTTLVNSGGAGFATVWSTGFERPNASTNNALFAGQTTPNLVIAPLGLDGKISIFTLSDADYLIDVMGVMVESTGSSDGRFVSLGPTRHSDTRFPNQHVPGQQRYAAGETRTVDLTAVGVPASASAVVLNVTADRTSAPSFVSLWPANQSNPGHSNVNVPVPNQATSNQVITGITNGRVNVFTLAATDLILDVAGYFTGSSAPNGTDGLFVPISPTRFLDTRDLIGPNAFTGGSKNPGGTSLRLPIAGRSDIPATGVKAGAFNVTAVLPDAPGFVTAFPSAGSVPATSSVNFNFAGAVVPNHAITTLSAAGSIDLFTLVSTHLVVDASGYFIDGTEPLPSGARPTKTIEIDEIAPPVRPDGGARPQSAPYDFLFDRGELLFTGSRPAPTLRVAWDACRPIRYALNVDLADDDQIEILISSIKHAESMSGIDFQFAGVTSAGLNLENEVLLADSLGQPYKYLPPDDDGSGDVDVVIGYSNSQMTPDLRGGVIGVGGSLRTAFDFTGRADAARGFAIIDLGDLGDGSADETDNLTATTTHELGHMIGLGHVDDGSNARQGLEFPGSWAFSDLSSQLMFPALNVVSTGTTFSDGDQLGLWELYNTAEQPCNNALVVADSEPGPLVAVEMIRDTADPHDDH